MDQKQFDAVLSDAEKRLRRLQVLYEQWFVGIERVEPAMPRKELEDMLTRLRKEQVTNTAQRFRLQQLVQRHVSFSTHWRRIGRQIEEGTYQRDLQRAKRRQQKGPSKEASGPEVDVGYDMDIDVDLSDVMAEADRAAEAALEERASGPGLQPMAAAGQAAQAGVSTRTFDIETGQALKLSAAQGEPGSRGLQGRAAGTNLAEGWSPAPQEAVLAAGGGSAFASSTTQSAAAGAHYGADSRHGDVPQHGASARGASHGAQRGAAPTLGIAPGEAFGGAQAAAGATLHASRGDAAAVLPGAAPAQDAMHPGAAQLKGPRLAPPSAAGKPAAPPSGAGKPGAPPLAAGKPGAPPLAAGKPAAPPLGVIAPPPAVGGARKPLNPGAALPPPAAGGEREVSSATMRAARSALRPSEPSPEGGSEAKRPSGGPRGISPFALPSAGSVRPKPLTPPKAPPPPPGMPKPPGSAPAAAATASADAAPSAAAARPAAGAQAAAARPGGTPAARPAPAVSTRSAAQPRAAAAANRPANTNGPGSSAFDMERIYSQYVAAREQNRERTDNVKRDTLEKTIRNMLPQLEKKHAGKKIDFEVVVKDGKVALKPVAK